METINKIKSSTLLLKCHIQMFPIILMPFNTILKFNKFVQFHSSSNLISIHKKRLLDPETIAQV